MLSITIVSEEAATGAIPSQALSVSQPNNINRSCPERGIPVLFTLFYFLPCISGSLVKETVSTETPRCFDAHSRKFYGETEVWKPNDCTVCTCRGGRLECLATVCRHPTCVAPLRVKGQCCPVCSLRKNTNEDSQGERRDQLVATIFAQEECFQIFFLQFSEMIKALAESQLTTVLGKHCVTYVLIT